MADNNPLLESFHSLFGKQGGDVLPGNVGMSRTVICTCRDLMSLDTPLVYDYFDAWDKREPGRKPFDTELHLVGNGQWEGAWALAQLHYDQQLKQEAKEKSRLHKGHPLCNLAIVGRVIGSHSLARHHALLSSAGDVYWEHVLSELCIGGLGPTLLEQFESTTRQDDWRAAIRGQPILVDKTKPVYLEAFLASRWFSDAHSQHFFNLAGVGQGKGQPFADVLLAAVDDPQGDSTTATGTRFEAAAGLVMSCTPGFEVDSARKTTDEQIDFVVRYTPDPLALLGFDSGFGLVECKSSASPVSVGELRDFGAKCLFHRVKFGILVARSGITGDTFAEPQMAELVRRRFQADGVTILVLQGRHLRGKTRLLRGVQDELCADHRFLAFGPIA